MRKKVAAATEGKAAGRDIHTDDRHIDIQGAHIIVQGDMHIHTGPVPALVPAPAPQRVVIVPGPEHIDDAQKVALQRLRGRWIALHNRVRETPLGHRQAWVRINNAAEATSYHLILRENYGKAVTYINKQIERLQRAETRDDDAAPANTP